MPWQFDIPEATVQRLSTYLAVLRRLEHDGLRAASSSEIARHANVNAAQVRKDLSYFGDFGRRGLGYLVGDLKNHLMRILGVDREHRVVLIGAGNLGAALAGYPGFEPRGFRISGVFDSNPAKVGQRLYEHEILSIDRLAEVLAKTGADMAIIAVPGVAAQNVVNALVAAGIRSILNLAPVRISAPPHVMVRSVDMTSQLELLSFGLTHEEDRASG
jgi:redox-sensing transcriptional repressor